MFISYALMVYILAFMNILLRVFISSKIAVVLAVFFSLVGLGLNIHEIAIRYVLIGDFQSSTLFDFSIFLSIAFNLTFLFLFYRYKKVVIGLFLIPFSIIFTAVSMFAPMAEFPSTVYSLWRFGHLPFVILGSTFFITSFISSIMYLIQDNNLRRKRFGKIYKVFPSLDTLNSINTISMRVGFYFFIIGSILGFLWIVQIAEVNDISWFKSLQFILSTYPSFFIFKILFSIITCTYFAILILIKVKYGLPPKKLAMFTVIGFFSVILTYIGVGVSL